MGATVATIQMNSSALERTVTYTVLLPDPTEAGEGPYDVLLQLHGKYDNHTSWLHKSNLLEYVKDLPLIVVLPDGANSFWSNLNRFASYEDMVIQDLRAHVEALFNVKKGSQWVLGGLSMGGFGALRLGLKHSANFCSVFAHSSVIPDMESLTENWPLWVGIDPSRASDLDCYRWADQLVAAKTAQPRLSFDCGVEDGLLEHNQKFHEHLEKIGLAHSYVEHPGAHTWDYWDKHVQTALAQHLEVLGISAKAKV
jgi:S-formylglutathione hydrolase FrmB